LTAHLSQGAGHGLARRADQVGNVLVGQAQINTNLVAYRAAVFQTQTPNQLCQSFAHVTFNQTFDHTPESTHAHRHHIQRSERGARGLFQKGCEICARNAQYVRAFAGLRAHLPATALI